MLDEWQTLIQNLADAGCDAALTQQFLALMKEGRTEEGLALLAQHRKRLLDCCHAEERKIDCLDYLVYRLERKTNA